MVQNIVNSINTLQDWWAFCEKVMKSNTYKHSWFVYTDCFNESDVRNGKTPHEVCIGKGLTEAEAKRIYEANKYGVENNGSDYAEIYYENLYDPNCSAAAYVYARATGENVDRALELQAIAYAVDKKFKANGAYN